VFTFPATSVVASHVFAPVSDFTLLSVMVFVTVLPATEEMPHLVLTQVISHRISKSATSGLGSVLSGIPSPSESAA